METTRFAVRYTVWSMVLMLIAFAHSVSAQSFPTQGSRSSGSGSGGASTLKNPLGEVTSIEQLIELIIKLALRIGIPIAALMIMYSGFLYVTAQGDPGKIKKANENFLWTVIGAAILLGAFVITSILRGTIDSLR